MSSTVQTWTVAEVHALVAVTTAARGNTTRERGGPVAPGQCVADQLLAQTEVSRVLRERVQLCQHPQTEFGSWRLTPRVKHREIDCGSKNTDAGSLQEGGGAQEKEEQLVRNVLRFF